MFAPRILLAIVSPLAVAAAQAPKHIAFVAESATSARTTAFAQFLSKRFAEVTVATHQDADPSALAKCDVVLLDWDQQTGVMQWMNGKSKPTSPLGPRENWHTPTVFLGSTGLNMSVPWNLRGGSG